MLGEGVAQQALQLAGGKQAQRTLQQLLLVWEGLVRRQLHF